MRHLNTSYASKAMHGFRHVWLPAAIVTLGTASLWLLAQGPDPRPKTNQRTAEDTRGGNRSIAGQWTYRSFISDPDLNTEPNKLLFGSGTLKLSQPAADQLAGTLGGDGWELNLKGKIQNGPPMTIRFQGRGMIGGEEWVYDYLGYVVPAWPNGVDQRPAIVGSIVRTVPHSGGTAKAGYVAQWIAVKQDAKAPPLKEGNTRQPLAEVLRVRRDRSAQLQAASRAALRKQATMSLDSDLRLPAPQRLSLARAASTPLRNPPVLNAADGTVTLEVKYADNTIGTDRVYLRSYNGKLVGPTLRVKAGQTLKIDLVNHLPNEPAGGPHVTNGHHEWNTTNLHTHGLHVKPQANPDAAVPAAIESDNVLLDIKPGATQSYAIEVPPDHPAGTFWYHAHRHGSTAAHVSSGMAGALIVTRDDNKYNLDAIAEVQAAMQTVGGHEREKIMVFQQVPYITTPQDPVGRVELANAGKMFGPGQWNQSNRYTTINGQQLPVIEFTAREIQRWRMIDTGFREGLSLQIVKDPADTGPAPDHLDFREIAVDGLASASVRVTSTLDMFPGYRSDVLVQAPAVAGTYHLIDALRTEHTLQGTAEPLKFVAKIVVKAPASGTMSMPTDAQVGAQRLPSLPTPAASTPVQQAYYGISGDFVIGTVDPGPFGAVSGSPYDPNVARPLQLGLVQKWRIGTRNDYQSVGDPAPPPAAGPAHPFHIHVNPFEIVSIKDENGVEQLAMGERIWRDTVSMPPGYTIEFLTKYADFRGSFVQHCHILDHEDQGMMQKITINAAGAGATAPPARNRVFASLGELPERPEVLFFVKGSTCPHCMAQLAEMSGALKQAQRTPKVAVVSASTPADLQAFPALPFALVADPGLALFKKHGAFDGQARHATIVLNRAGKEVFRKVGDEPFLDAKAILAALAQAGPSFVIAVRGTDETVDDYITWSATACTIRMMNGDPAGAPVTVTLTNDDPSANPTAGELRFAQTLAPKATATLTSLTLQVKQDGTPVPFYIAGVKASTLTPASLPNGGRDTKIVIHQGNATGARLGEHAVMVRVRKALRHPSDPQPKLSDFELQEFLKALRDLHQIDHRLEWYVQLHRLATGHGTDFGLPFDPPMPQWPDQAHAGPAFIAWHRAFLLQFERELQVRYPHVALPYWVQGTPQTFFADDRLGAPGTIDDVVLFRPGSPLYGWSISLPMDRGTGSDAMGQLRRRTLDHNDPNAPVQAGTLAYRQWADLAMLSSIGRFSVFRTEESNPHNNGHVTVGPDGMWMYNCRESNADPVFYVFHCNQDYLWAKWQYELDRFVNDGSDPNYYSPADAFTDKGANQTIPLGHHLKDKMWPWDGTSGQVIAGVVTANRPTTNGFGAFPASRVRSLWPPAAAQPTPGNVIDYQGILSATNDLGYCYDALPFGARPATAIAVADALVMRAAEAQRLALAVVSDRTASADTRLLALRSLRSGGAAMTPDALKQLAGIASSNAAPPDLRSHALRQWFAAAPADAFHTALALIGEKQAPLKLRLTAVHVAARQLHFADVPHAESHRAVDRLRALLADAAPGQLKAAAIRSLAPLGDALAKKELLASLASPDQSPLALHEAIALLRFFPDQKARMRGFLASANDRAVVAAVHALFNDRDSLEARRQLARDAARSHDARVAAIQSLMHDDSADQADFLIAMAADPAVDVDLRTEALASATVRLRKTAKTMTADARRSWTKRLEAIRAAETTDLGRVRRDALNVVAPKP